MSTRSRTRVLAVTAVTAATLLTAPAAWAEDPFRAQPGERVIDASNTVGNTGELVSEVDALAQEHGVTLYVVYVDAFTNPDSPGEWVKDFADRNGFGSNDIVLAVATETRQARLDADTTGGKFSKQDLQKIYDENVLPALRSSDWEGAGQGAVDGINAKFGGVSLDGAGGMVGGVLVLGGVAAAGAGIAMASRRRRRGRETTTGQPGNWNAQPTPPQPQVSLEELRTRAGEALVAADNAIQHSEQELAFAQLQYGPEQTQPFERALATAKEHMRASFQLQHQLDDSVPDTPQEQRAWLSEIIDRSHQAKAPLQEQEASFAQLRQLETRAPEALAQVESLLGDLAPQLHQAESQVAQLAARYDDAALASVRDDAHQARELLEFAQQTTQEARTALDAGNTSEAVVDVRAAEGAVGQAQTLITGIAATPTELARAEENLKDAVSIAQRDIAESERLVREGAHPELAGPASGMRSVLDTVTRDMAGGRYDPVGSLRRLQQAKEELDRGLGGVRDRQDRARAARETLTHTLASAQSALSTASQYIWARRGGVGSHARTQLAEAERHLQTAQQLQSSDPERALSEANQVIRLAEEAQRSASGDVDHFGSQGGYGRGGNAGGFNGAMLGGLILGGLLNGGNSGGGGSWGGGFGGGGGGGFGGGFGGGGGFDGGVGGNF